MVEKARDDEQAAIWKKEKVDHEDFLKTKTKLEKTTYKEYQNCLKDQMKERERRDRKNKGKPNQASKQTLMIVSRHEQRWSCYEQNLAHEDQRPQDQWHGGGRWEAEDSYDEQYLLR